MSKNLQGLFREQNQMRNLEKQKKLTKTKINDFEKKTKEKCKGGK